MVAAVLPFSTHPAWWIRVFDFPRLQLLVGTLVTAAATAAIYGHAGQLVSAPALTMLALLVGAAAVQGVQMFPYTPLAEPQVKRASGDGPTLRVVTSNVLMENRDFDRWLKVVEAEDADVVAAVETDAWWAERLKALDGYPHVVAVPRDDTYGMVLLSRLPIERHEVRYLVEETVPSIWATLTLDGRPVELVVVHPRPPRPELGQDADLRDAELVRAGLRLAEIEHPAIIIGDLNDVAWSHTSRLFQRLSGLLDPRRGRGLYSTFHADYRALRYPLDHVFHSTHFTLVDLRVLDHVGSDHFPMVVALRLEPKAAQPKPTPKGDDREEAAEKVERGDEKVEEESEAERRERIEEDQ